MDSKSSTHSSGEISWPLVDPLLMPLTASKKTADPEGFVSDHQICYARILLFFVSSRQCCFALSVTQATVSPPPFVLFYRLSNRFTLCLNSLHSASNHGAAAFSPANNKRCLHRLSNIEQKRHTCIERLVRITCNLFSRVKESIFKLTTRHIALEFLHTFVLPEKKKFCDDSSFMNSCTCSVLASSFKGE